MKKSQLIISLAALSVAFATSIKPVEAQSFWHQVKDQASNRHGWQYGYGTYPQWRNYGGHGGGHGGGYYGGGSYGTGYNPWGAYGAQQGWGHQQVEQHQLQEHQQQEQHQYSGH
jgi:hypothetical protein